MQKKFFIALLGTVMFAGAMMFNVNEVRAHKTKVGAIIERLIHGDAPACASRVNSYCYAGGVMSENYDRIN